MRNEKEKTLKVDGLQQGRGVRGVRRVDMTNTQYMHIEKCLREIHEYA